MKKLRFALYIVGLLFFANFSSYAQCGAFNADLLLSAATPVPHCEQVPIKLQLSLNKSVTSLLEPFTLSYTDPLLGPQTITGISAADFDATLKIYEFSVPGYSGDYILTGFESSDPCAVGISGTNTVTVSIKPPTTISFSPVAPYTSIGMPVNVTALATNTDDPTGASSTYSWVDLVPSVLTPPLTNNNVDFTSASAGTFNVTCVATDINGCQSTDQIAINVYLLKTNLTASSTSECAGTTVTLNGNPTDGSGTYNNTWSVSPFGTVTATGTGTTAEFTSVIPGLYTITYTVVDLLTGASSSDNIDITINSAPATKTINVVNRCIPIDGSVTVVSSDVGVDYNLYESGLGFLGTEPGTGGNVTWVLGVGDYSVIATNATGCSTTHAGPYTIGAYIPPTVSPTAVDPTICEGGSTVLNANAVAAPGSSIATYTWNNAPLLSVPNTVANPTAYPIALGTTTYTVTVVDDKGCKDIDAVDVDLTAAPVVTILSTDNPICVGQSTTLSATSDKTVASWNWETGPSMVNPAIDDTTVSPVITKSYDLLVTDTDGCSTTETYTVTVKNNPTANAGLDKKMCLGAGTTLSGSATGGTGPGTYTFSWSGGTIVSPTDVTVNPTPAGVYPYTLTVVDANNCSDDDVVNVTAVINPTVDAGANQTSCSGDLVNLNATPLTGLAPFTYSWEGGAYVAATNYDVNPTNPVGSAPLLETYDVMVKDANGCFGSDNVNVTVNSYANIIISNNGKKYCNDADSVILSATPTGGTWAELSGTITISPFNKFLPGDYASGFYTFEYSYTGIGGCVTTKQATIEILPYGTPNLTDIDIENEPLFCSTDVGPYLVQGTMVPDLAGQAGVVETFSGNGITNNGDGTASFDPNAAGVGVHTITYNVTTSGCSNLITENVTVGTPVTINNPVSMCVGDADSVLIASNPVGEFTITFIDDATSTTNVFGPYVHGDPNAVLQATEPGKYYISYRLTTPGAYNCSPVDSTIVYGLPVVNFTIDGNPHTDLDINFCENGSSVTLLGNNAINNVFSSVPDAVAGNQFDPTTGDGTYIITYTHTDANGCANSVNSQIVTVNPTPVVTIDNLNAAYCKNDAAFTITGSPISGINPGTGLPEFGSFSFPLTWTSGTQYTDNGNGTAEIDPLSISIAGGYNIIYQVTDLNGCSGSVTRNFDINPLPTVDFNGLPATICKNGVPVTLIGSPTDANGTFSGDGITPTGPGTAKFDPSGVTIGTHTITYTYIDPLTNCENSIPKNIQVLALPQKFIVTSPGGLEYCETDPGITIGISNSQAPAPGNYTYSLIQNGLTTVDTQIGTGAPLNFAGNYPAGSYTVTAKNSDNCQVSFNNTIVAVEAPVIDDAGSITGSTSVCADGITIYTYSVAVIANATDHVWVTPAGVTIDADRDNEIDVIFDPTFIGGDFIVYGEDITSACPAGNSSSLTVTVKPVPTVAGGTVISGDNVVCLGETNKLYSINPADFSNEISFEWQTTSGTIMTNPNASSVTVNYAAGSVSGTLRVRARNSCSTSAWVSLPITVNPIPNVSIDPLGAGDVIDCSVGSEVQLNATTTSVGVATWSWTASNGGVILAGDENVQNPRVTNEGDFEVQIELITAGQACYNTASITVGSNKTPPTVNILGSYEIDCNNLTETINATGDADPATTYLWAGPGIVGINTGLNITVNQPGVYTITATGTNGCTNSDAVTVIDDTQAPDITVGTALDITCTRTSVQISGSSPTADIYLWTLQAGTGNITNANAAIANVDGPGTFRLTVTNSANGCSNFDDVIVTKNVTLPGLVVTDPSTNELTCTATNVQLEASAAAGATYSWSTGIVGATISDPLVANPYVNKAGIYTVVARHPITGCTETDDVTVNTDYQKPTINIIPEALEISCSQTTIELDASTSTNATSFVWSTTDGSILNGGATNKATISKAGTYNVVVTNGATGCTETGQVIITEDIVKPNVNITGGPYEITCADPDPVLSATVDAGSSVLWTGPGVIANATTTSPTVNVDGTYIITATAANGCTSTDNVLVTLNNNPPNITIDTTVLDITCTRLNVNVTGTSTTFGATYQWQMLTGGGNVTNPTSQTATVDAIGTYKLTVKAPNGCTNSDVIEVKNNIVAPIIALPAVDDEVMTCNQSTVTLNASAVPVSSQYSWSTLTGATITNPNSPTPVVNKSGDYTVTVTDPANGCTATATTNVTADMTPPAMSIVPVAVQISCTNPTIVLDASTSVNAINYSWTASLGGNIVLNPNTANPTVNAAGRYTVTGEHNVTGCTATAFIDITKDNSIPTIDVFNSTPNDITCANLTTNLSGDATAVVNKTILWTTTDGNITSANNITNPTVDAAGTYVLKITNDDNGCYTIKGVNVISNKTLPTIDFEVPDDITCSSPQISLKVNAASVDGSPLTYNWTAGAGGNIVSGPTTTTPVVDAVADYTVDVTDQGNGCINSGFVSVAVDTVKANVLVDVTPDQITCNNATVILDGSSDYVNVSYKWTTTGPGSIVNSTTENPTVNAAGTYNLQVTNLDNGCVSVSNDVNVTSNTTLPNVTVFAPSGDITCNDSEVTISVSSDPDYIYSWAGPGNITTPNSNSTDVDADGTYTVFVEDIYNGCNKSYTVDVLDDLTPVVSPSIDNIETCFGSANPAFNVLFGTNVKWYDDASLLVYLGTGNSYTPIVSAAGIHTYYATSTGANGCESLPKEVTLTIHALPITPTTIGNSICEGGTAKIITAIGTNIRWYDNTSVFIQAGATYSPVVGAAGTYTYYATQTNAEGCESAQKSAIYTVNPVPSQPVFTNPSIEICETETNPIFNVVGDNILWYKNIGGSVVATGNAHQPNEILPGTYNYYATQTVSGCESAEAIGDFTIYPIPEVYNVINGGAYCEGSTGVDISLSNSETGVNYELWIDEASMVADIAGTTGLAISFGDQTQVGNYTVYAYNTATLCRYKMNGSVNVSIKPLPDDAPVINGDAEVCQNETGIVYSVNPISNATSYVWSVPPGFSIVSGDNSNSILVNIDNTAASGNITVYAKNACGDGVTSPILFVKVNPIPGPALNLTGPNVICKDHDGAVYTIDADANATHYNWTLPQGASIVAGGTSRQITLNFDLSAVNDVITVAPANTCGEGTSASQAITVNDLPYVNAGDQQDLCIDNTILDANTPVVGTGTWTIYNGAATFPVGGENNPVTSITDIGEGNNRLIWTVVDLNGCSLSDTVLITNNSVYVEAGNNPPPVCEESIILNASAVPAGAVGSWSATTGTASFTDGNSPGTEASDFASGTNILRWSVTKNGCTNFDTLIVQNQRPTQAYAGIDQSICRDTTQLGGNNPAVGTGEWTVVVGSATFDDKYIPNTIVRGLSKGENILRWTISNGICSTFDEVKITNNKLAINAGVDQVICDKTTTLDAIAPASGTGYWSVSLGAATFVQIDLYNTIVTGLAKGTNELTWNVNNNGCISSDTVLITNDSPTTAYAGKDTVVTTNFVTLQGNIPTTGSGVWTLISGSGNIENPTVNNTTVTSLGSGENRFRWTITNNSCISTDDVLITNYMSTETDAGPDQTICGSEASLEGNEPTLGYGEWSVIKGSASFIDPSNPATKVMNLAKGDNILRWSVWQNGWTSDDVVITNDSPTDANAGLDQVLCVDSTILAGNNPIVGNGIWTIVSGAGTFENDTLFNTKVKNLAKGENIFKWTITNKSCSSTDIVIIRNDFPTVAYAGVDQLSCESSITLYPNTPSVGVGAWSVVSGSANFDGNIAKNMAKDVNVFRWTIANNACSSYDDVTITNHEPSDANAGANKVICTDSISLAANIVIVGNGVWTQQSGSSTFDPLNPTTKVTNLSQGLNIFRWTVTYNTCVKFDEVTVNNAYVEAIAGLDQEICSETTNLEANNPSAGIGAWSVLGGSGSANFEDINQPDTRVSELDKGQNILRWTITNDICISTSDVIITNSLPTEAFAGPDQAICANSSILQANTPIEGVGAWSILSGSADITSGNNPSSTVNNLNYGINTLRWTITKGSCISSDEVVIANNSTIPSNAGLDQSLCKDSTILYANVPTYGVGTWSVVSGSATFEDNNDYNTKVVSIGKGDNVLRWVISNGGCSSSDEVIITNNSPIKAIAGADQTICGNTTTLQANYPMTYNGSWSLVSGAADFASSSQYNTSVTGLNPGPNTLRWTIENKGCSSTDDVVIYNDLPYVADAGENFEICGPTSPLYANDPVIGLGQWTVVSGSATFNDATRFDATVSDLGFGANTLRWTITYDHCTTYDEIIVKNNKLKVYAGIDQVIGESSTLLAASNPSTGTGLWTTIGGSGVFASPSNSITMVTGLGSGLNTFRWSVNINGCISYDDVSVTYNVPPIASFVVTSINGCPPLETYFVNNSLDGLPFTWDFDDGNSSDQVTVKHVYNEPGIYRPSLTVLGVNGEVIVKDTVITVYNQPHASFLVVNTQVYIPEEEAIFINTSTDAINYQWEFGDGGTSTEESPRYTYETEGIYDVILHAWSENDCYDLIKVVGGVEVYESGTVVFPTAFTPSFDGPSGGAYNPNDFSNDVFYPIGEGIENYHLEVFNRWGVLVFESSDINIGWDGYYDNKLLDEGVFVWKVTGKYNNGKDFKKVGTVMLLH